MMKAELERGPKPASPLPWEQEDQGEKYREALVFHSGRSDSRVDGAVADVVSDLYDYNADAAAIVHRVNNWDALWEERNWFEDRLEGETAKFHRAQDKAEKLKAMLAAETDLRRFWEHKTQQLRKGADDDEA
jgi:hypothetical protein